MNKNYKKFYEIGNSKYYTLTADNELYLASESFIKVRRKLRVLKPLELSQGLKLLKISPPIIILFGELANLKPLDNQENVSVDMLHYNKVDNKNIRLLIIQAYDLSTQTQINALDTWKEKILSDTKTTEESLDYRYNRSLEIIKQNDPIGRSLFLEVPKESVLLMDILKLKHLFTEKITGFVNNTYLYAQDVFGTLTIYKLISIKGIIKSVDTFIYDIKLVKELLETIENKEEK